MHGLPPPQPLPIKERSAMVFVEYGQIDVLDGAFVVVDANGIRTHIPVGGVACILLEPGTRISHAAVTLAARTGTLLIWCGEGAVRLYAAGAPGGARADRLLHQARLALDETARIKVARRMYEIRFGERPPENRSIEQLRGIEGARVKRMYENIARSHRVQWKGRRYDTTEWGSADIPNRCLSSGTACLYGICEAAILAAGYAPAIGFIHTGRPQSFVYDIADLYKFETVVPAAFAIAARASTDVERQTRIACRDMFRKTRLLERLIPEIESLLAAGGLAPPSDDPETERSLEGDADADDGRRP